MNSYNGRQITQMRFKDVRELEKFKFITGNYDFGDEVLEHASQDKKYRPFIDAMIESNNKNQTTKPLGIIVNDSPDAQFLYVGTIAGNFIDMFCTSINSIYRVEMLYDIDTDKLTITTASEELMSTDNVKTLFGEQSIIGSGNIDLYNHFLTVTASDGSKLYINYPSSKNLECDSLQDLTQMTKAVNGTKIGFGSTYINYNGSIWQTANSTAITAVSDVVTTL